VSGKPVRLEYAIHKTMGMTQSVSRSPDPDHSSIINSFY
jgi:hypothetical protein